MRYGAGASFKRLELTHSLRAIHQFHIGYKYQNNEDTCIWVHMIPDDDHNEHRHISRNQAGSNPKPCDEQAMLLFMKGIQRFNTYPDLWEAVTHLICKILNVSGSGIMLLDRNREEFFIPVASIDDPHIESLFMETRFASGKSPFENFFSNVDASIVHSFKTAPHPFQFVDSQLRDFIVARIDVPLRLKETIIGTLWAVNPSAGFFDANAAVLMGALAGITGSAMESIRIDARLNMSNQQLKDFNLARDHAVDHLSHAIKTPLAVTIASLKLLEKQLRRLPAISWKRIFDRAERNLKRLLTIEYDLEDILRQQHQSAGDESFSFLSDAAPSSSNDQRTLTSPLEPFATTNNDNEPT